MKSLAVVRGFFFFLFCSLQLIKQFVFGCRQDEEHCTRTEIVSFSLTLYETVELK